MKKAGVFAIVRDEMMFVRGGLDVQQAVRAAIELRGTRLFIGRPDNVLVFEEGEILEGCVQAGHAPWGTICRRCGVAINATPGAAAPGNQTKENEDGTRG